MVDSGLTEILVDDYVGESHGQPVFEKRPVYDFPSSDSSGLALPPHWLSVVTGNGYRPLFAPELARMQLDNPSHPLCTRKIVTGSLVLSGYSASGEAKLIFVHEPHPFLSLKFMEEKRRRENDIFSLITRLSSGLVSTQEVEEVLRGSPIESVPSQIFEEYLASDGKTNTKGDRVVFVMDAQTRCSPPGLSLMRIEDFVRDPMYKALLGIPDQECEFWGDWYKGTIGPVINTWEAIIDRNQKNARRRAHFLKWGPDPTKMYDVYSRVGAGLNYLEPEGKCSWSLRTDFHHKVPSLFKRVE